MPVINRSGTEVRATSKVVGPDHDSGGTINSPAEQWSRPCLAWPLRVRFSFDIEPASTVGPPEAGPGVDISIYEFPHMAASVGASGDDGTLMWRTTEPRSVFARAVMEAAQSVLQRFGEERH